MPSKKLSWASALILALATLPGPSAADVERRWIHFSSDGISLAGHLYVPISNSSSNFAGVRRPAIVVGHPHGGVKEQTSGQYAREIAEQGRERRLPRYLEDPYQRANNVRNAVTYPSTLDIVDPDNIGALGVCASGGYVPFAAQTDKRIEAVARLLLDGGAHTEAADEEGRTPLSWATARGHEAVVRLLQFHSAQPSSTALP